MPPQNWDICFFNMPHNVLSRVNECYGMCPEINCVIMICNAMEFADALLE
jgi:hypothetical protein